MSSTTTLQPAQHYRRAEELLTAVERHAPKPSAGTGRARVLLALAQVHATLATAVPPPSAAAPDDDDPDEGQQGQEEDEQLEPAAQLGDPT